MRSTDPMVVVTTKRPGPSHGPLVVVTPAWAEPDQYDELIAALSGDTTVVSLEVWESPDSDKSQFHQLERVTEEAVRLVAPLAAGRPTAIVGYSTDGIVAHELGRRLGESSGPVRVVALLDTF